MASATVIVPTHSHGETLRLSVGSALAQTHRELEVIICGDGVDAATRRAALALEASDPRVRFLDQPKAPGQGFENRHRAVQAADGELIFWLADDDLWFPDHVARLAVLLRDAHFANSLVVGVAPDGEILVKSFDLGRPGAREQLAAGGRFIPMAMVCHRRATYLELPLGWCVKHNNQRLMYAQFGQREDVVCASLLAPTALHLPSTQRRETSLAQRVAELERWSGVLADERLRRGFLEDVVAHLATRTAKPRPKPVG